MDAMTLMLILHIILIILIVIVLIIGTFTHANSGVVATLITELLSLLNVPSGGKTQPTPPSGPENGNQENGPKAPGPS